MPVTARYSGVTLLASASGFFIRVSVAHSAVAGSAITGPGSVPGVVDGDEVDAGWVGLGECGGGKEALAARPQVADGLHIVQLAVDCGSARVRLEGDRGRVGQQIVRAQLHGQRGDDGERDDG